MEKLYPGIGIIGSEKTSGIYGLNQGIIDAKGTGIQHLFFNQFSEDWVHSASCMIKKGQTLYYGNRKKEKSKHQVHLTPVDSRIEQGYMMVDKFVEPDLSFTHRVYAFNESQIGFEVCLENPTRQRLTLDVYTYLILRNNVKNITQIEGDKVVCQRKETRLEVKAQKDLFESFNVKLFNESPTGFLYQTTNALLYDEIESQEKIEGSDLLVGVLMGGKLDLEPQASKVFKWTLYFNGESDNQLSDEVELDGMRQQAQAYWQRYLDQSQFKPQEDSEYIPINLIALKAAMIKGFVPADLTGHYFSEGMPSYYARDAMMVARAFLYAGYYKEAKSIMIYLHERKRKKTGEFYQRYNGLGQPSEGANNNVFHQYDSIGYFLKNIYDYQLLTGDKLISEHEILLLLEALYASEKKYGLVGPEGGVNEGVYGPAFITSSNMCIYGGLSAAEKMIQEEQAIHKIKRLKNEMMKGIESTYEEGVGYRYGYVDYHDHLIRKYDTPVYFGCLYGFDLTENMFKTHQYLLRDASYFGEGIGYSEQEYHHGPWIFNTAACAEYAYLAGDLAHYHQKMAWLKKHSNQYGLFPEAISADNEAVCYINPLIWAGAEFIAASFINHRLSGLDQGALDVQYKSQKDY